ncbi:protein kinase domain containing protein [Stylonychia lemnae]|uniref:non-specific serine/threonine protein kinase n=1 Tax=Stylonychia lemnae TaxID=5949 RepID=A0A078BAP2_STYLE|nr:protein kinase domain containing protein [Stylonychia lemnae]|eukprot:CDW91424.1 protein kinase domain containing protein [Stylonychia lemnae]
MGNCITQNTNVQQNSPSSSDLNSVHYKNSFEKQMIIGQGGFSRVWKVQSRKNPHDIYALKEMSKAKVILKNSLAQILMEKTILSKMKNDFIVNMHAAFTDRDSMFLVLDYCNGGDLRYQMQRQVFNEKETKFMIACLVQALECIHTAGVIHRDIKPENLVFNENGYLRLTDFGIARQVPFLQTQNTTTDFQDNSAPKYGIIDTSGTPGYMSPEALCQLPQSYTTDYFAMGVIIHEMILRKRPYNGKSKQQIRESMITKQVQIKDYEVPVDWSSEAADFCNLLLKRRPQDRLGFSFGIQDLKDHAWFKGFDWKALSAQKLKAPWVPPKGDNFRKRETLDFFDGSQNFFNEDEEMDFLEIQKIILRDDMVKLFQTYNYQSPTSNIINIRPLNKLQYKSFKEKQMSQLKQKSRNQSNIEKLNRIKPQIIEDKYHEVKVQECEWNEFEQPRSNKSANSVQVQSFSSTAQSSRKGSFNPNEKSRFFVKQVKIENHSNEDDWN